AIGAVRFALGQRTLISWKLPGILHIWDATTGKEHVTSANSDYGYVDFAISANENTLAMTGGNREDSWDTRISVWNLRTGRLTQRIFGGWDMGRRHQFSLSPNGKLLAACDDESK